MRNERKYKIISLLTTLLAALLFGNCVREYWRMETAVYRQHEEYVLKGAKTYAANCAQCHGPKGEGVIGMPLNRKDLQVDYTAPAGKDVYNMLVNTLKQGRPGNPNHFQWEKTPDGKWISYSTMPAWGRDFGGPLDDDYIKALALFIMKPDGTQWDLVGDTEKAPFPDPGIYDPVTKQVDPKKINLPNQDKSEHAAAVALLKNVPKSQCLGCHTIGAQGGKVGPDLTHVGSWGVDEKFLVQWISYASPDPRRPADQFPKGIPHDVRMPVYWSANRATIGPNLKLDTKVVSEGPYNMPSFKGKLTDDEITAIARYLLSLKAGQ